MRLRPSIVEADHATGVRIFVTKRVPLNSPELIYSRLHPYHRRSRRCTCESTRHVRDAALGTYERRVVRRASAGGNGAAHDRPESMQWSRCSWRGAPNDAHQQCGLILRMPDEVPRVSRQKRRFRNRSVTTPVVSSGGYGAGRLAFCPDLQVPSTAVSPADGRWCGWFLERRWLRNN